MRANRPTYYYRSYTDDFVESKQPKRRLTSADFGSRSSPLWNAASTVLYRLFEGFAGIANRLVWHVRFHRAIRMVPKDSGFFVYANHTQPFRDVFLPALAFRRKRLYVLAGRANYGIPIIGRLLPMLGAIPVLEGRDALARLRDTIALRLSQKHGVVIYPEAHVWPYYTGIRPYSTASFQYPAQAQVPVFCMTTTYQKKKYGQRPRIVVYLDGPFYGPKDGSIRQRKQALHDQVYACMQERSQNSTYAYIQYERESE